VLCCVVLTQGGEGSTSTAEAETAAAATGQWQESDADGPYMRMFWLDASEEQVYIIILLLSLLSLTHTTRYMHFVLRMCCHLYMLCTTTAALRTANLCASIAA
jgi:hypothetical protein